jgi:hypothetical protein
MTATIRKPTVGRRGFDLHAALARPPPARGGSGGLQKVEMRMDGREVAEIVAHHIARLAQLNMGLATFDGTLRRRGDLRAPPEDAAASASRPPCGRRSVRQFPAPKISTPEPPYLIQDGETAPRPSPQYHPKQIGLYGPMARWAYNSTGGGESNVDHQGARLLLDRLGLREGPAATMQSARSRPRQACSPGSKRQPKNRLLV